MGQVQPTNGLNIIFPKMWVDMLTDKCDIDLRDEVLDGVSYLELYPIKGVLDVQACMTELWLRFK